MLIKNCSRGECHIKKKIIIISIIIFLLGLVIVIIVNNSHHKKHNIVKNKVEKKVINNNVDTNDEAIPDNEDIVGKIKIDGTNIDEYIVQGSDNEYYLNHNLNNEEDIAGSVFLDYRNNFDDQKLLIFGHNARRLKTVPFHDLEKYKDQSFYNENKYINLRLNSDDTKWIIFSVMLVKKGDNTHMTLNFTDNEWINHIKWLKDNSLYDTNVNVLADDRILILQTCNYNPDDMYILISAKKYK